MLQLKHINLTQYKNYEYFNLALNRPILGICGRNGRGKTNLLDAVFYACFTKSYFTSSDLLCTKKDFNGFRIELEFSLNEQPQKIVCIYRGGKKEIFLNDVPYEKFSEHIGKFPVVMIAPDDIELIIEGSEVRRKFIDTMISQLDSEYLKVLITYNRILTQRNSLLKQWYNAPDHMLLDILDAQLIPAGNFIFRKRQSFLQNFSDTAHTYYNKISGEAYSPSIRYHSQLMKDDFEKLLKQSRERDILMQRSNTGIHKDDLIFLLEEIPFKNIASQGQKKSLLFALKLAEYDIIIQEKKHCILLLDDVFEKLDEHRITNLMNWVCKECKGQVMITDTHRERLETSFKNAGVEAQIIVLGD